MNRQAKTTAAAGFTLTEILIAMFIMVLGIVGVMSLFPVGLDATTRAINNKVVYLASQTAFAQVNYMVNTSEVFDYRLRNPWYRVAANSTAITQTPTTVYCEISPGAASGAGVDWRAQAQYPFMYTSRAGHYLLVTSGTGAGQVRRIDSTSMAYAASFHVTVSSPFLDPLNRPMPLDNSSCFVITKWALPRSPGSPRMARVVSASGNSITAKRMDAADDNFGTTGYVNWTPNEFSRTGAAAGVDARFFVVFTSGLAKGKVLPVTSNTASSVNVTRGIFSAAEPANNNWLNTGDALNGRVRRNDSFVILGAREVSAVFPFGPPDAVTGRPTASNFGAGNAEPDQTIPFGANRKDWLNDPEATIAGSSYSYAIIMSNSEDVNANVNAWAIAPIPIPRDAFSPEPARRGKEASVPLGARVDVLVFLNYNHMRTIQDQSPQTLIGVSTSTISSFF